MKLATLVYVRNHDATLMLHRVKKANDMHEGKWNGLGGKIEPGETPEVCAIREVMEESGLTIRNPRLCGFITFPAFAKQEDWHVFILAATEYSGELIDSAEGILRWVPHEELPTLPMWAGDRVFMRWLDEPGFFSARFDYTDGVYRGYEGMRYLPGGEMAPLCGDAHSDTNSSAHFNADIVPAAPAPEPPSGFDDQICWLCSGATDKRNCKIICRVCGFTRDCSDP